MQPSLMFFNCNLITNDNDSSSCDEVNALRYNGCIRMRNVTCPTCVTSGVERSIFLGESRRQSEKSFAIRVITAYFQSACDSSTARHIRKPNECYMKRFLHGSENIAEMFGANKRSAHLRETNLAGDKEFELTNWLPHEKYPLSFQIANTCTNWRYDERLFILLFTSMYLLKRS
ncbi:hypothetical protein ALC53_11399 [Atta colombica]|uniref:Uncharacterized protein n=1 Tax=Atta colombica TaxID=520822 RepID=A0A195B1X7_9HYME|nr:hypothetical protein ALC53_11399 [Atta colombica]